MDNGPAHPRSESNLDSNVDSTIASTRISTRLSPRLEFRLEYRLGSTIHKIWITLRIESTRRLVTWRPDITSAQHFLGAARPHGPNTTCRGLQARRAQLAAQATIIFTPAPPRPRSTQSRRHGFRDGDQGASGRTRARCSWQPRRRPVINKAAPLAVSQPRACDRTAYLSAPLFSHAAAARPDLAEIRNASRARGHIQYAPAVRPATNETHTASAAAILQCPATLLAADQDSGTQPRRLRAGSRARYEAPGFLNGQCANNGPTSP